MWLRRHVRAQFSRTARCYFRDRNQIFKRTIVPIIGQSSYSYIVKKYSIDERYEAAYFLAVCQVRYAKVRYQAWVS